MRQKNAFAYLICRCKMLLWSNVPYEVHFVHANQRRETNDHEI